jgi:hypothetical protein
MYNTKEGDIDLSKLVRLYPASVVELNGDVAEMSLEWTDMNQDKVKVLNYVLVFDFTPQGQEEKVKTTLSFDTKDELILEMRKVSETLNG